jgi:hypothetical protein
MADDDYAAEWNNVRTQLHNEIEKLCQRIDDLDRKIIIARGRSSACRLCSSSHPKHPGDPEITDVERTYHDAGHRFRSLRVRVRAPIRRVR